MNTTYAARPARAAFAYATTTLVAYGLIVVGLGPRVGKSGIAELAALPVLGAACTVLLVWVFRLDRLALVLAGAGALVAWLATGWSPDLVPIYALGLACGAVPGVLSWRWHCRRERLPKWELAIGGAGVAAAVAAAVYMPGWLPPATTADAGALVSLTLVPAVVADGLAQLGLGRLRRFHPTRATWIRLGWHLLALAGLVAAEAYLASRISSPWAVLAVPPLVMVFAVIALVRRASAGRSMPRAVAPAFAVVSLLTVFTCTVELARSLGPGQLGWLIVICVLAGAMLAPLRARVAIVWQRVRGWRGR